MLSPGMLAAFATMFIWGIADFMYSVAVKKIGSLKAMLISNAIGALPCLILVLVLFFMGKLVFNKEAAALLAAGGLINTFAVINFLKSFEIGEVSIVTPISATYPVITLILAVIFLSEALSVIKIVSVVLILAGIILTSTDLRKLRHIRNVKGVKEAVCAMAAWGVYFFMVGLVSKKIDFINVYAYTSIIGQVLMIGAPFFLGARAERKDMRKDVLTIFIINTVLYALAWILFNFSIANELVSIVTPISSLYPAITVLLAVVFLKDRLANNQKVGIFVILSGIFLVGV